MTAGSHDFAAKPVRRGEEEAHYRQVKDFAYHRWRTARGWSWFLSAILLVAMASNFALSSGVRVLFPLVRIQPVYFGVLEDGTVTTALNIDDPNINKDAVIKSALWLYVRCWVGYSYAEAQRCYDIVDAMSNDTVKAAHEAEWFLPDGKDNPQSLQKTIANNGHITLDLINAAFIRDHVLQFRFRRTVEMYDVPQRRAFALCKPPACTTETATVDIVRREQMPVGKKVGGPIDNPLGLMVVRWQLSQGAD